MSVLIKGMDMPKNCDECPCYYETEGAWRNECEVLGKEYIADDYRPEWCPLVELPPHGRLIDADVLTERLVQGLNNSIGQAHAYYRFAMAWINESKTIIEAEEVGE